MSLHFGPDSSETIRVQFVFRLVRVKYFVRGYHEYETHWEAEVGEEASLKREPEIKFSSNTVAVVISHKRHHLEALGNKLIQILIFISQSLEMISFV